MSDPRKRGPEKREYYLKNRDRIIRVEKARRLRKLPELKNYQLQKRYGITLQDFEKMLADQKGVCAICGSPSRTRGRSLSVDHDHKAGKVRGVLCGPCNAGLGNFQESPEILLAAICYLRKHL